MSQLSQSQAAVTAKVDTKLKHKIFWVASTKIVQSGVVMRSLCTEILKIEEEMIEKMKPKVANPLSKNGQNSLLTIHID